MRPTRSDDAIVDLLDVVLRDGVVLQADVVVTVADVPLVGISLRAAVAGMTTMTEYGFFEDWHDGRPTDREGRRDTDEHVGERTTDRSGRPWGRATERSTPRSRPDN